jgi:hypothetical protein
MLVKILSASAIGPNFVFVWLARDGTTCEQAAAAGPEPQITFVPNRTNETNQALDLNTLNSPKKRGGDGLDHLGHPQPRLALHPRRSLKRVFLKFWTE